MAENDAASIVLENGTALKLWKSYAINSNFLTPTDGWDFTFGTEVEWKRVKDMIAPDSKIQILIDGVLQLTGWIDSYHVEASAEGGTSITVHGRDVMKPLVKSNVYPGMAIKGKTIADIITSVLAEVYPYNTPLLYTDPEANRLLIADPSKKYRKASNSKANSKRKSKAHNVLEYYEAHPQEGAFEFISRMLRKSGMWLWPTADGNFVVGGPDYEQPSMYVIHRTNGDSRAQVTRSSYTFDKTSVPSYIHVAGKGASKDFAKVPVNGLAQDPSHKLYCPIYIKHDEATTNEEAQNFADQEMSRLKQNERVYECTVRGHRNVLSNAFYQPNTIATVVDEILGIDEELWILDRTFRKSVDAGTTTDLKMIPKNAIQLADCDAP